MLAVRALSDLFTLNLIWFRVDAKKHEAQVLCGQDWPGGTRYLRYMGRGE
jgi:hypothetical protein